MSRQTVNTQQQQFRAQRAIRQCWPVAELGDLATVEPTRAGVTGSTFVASTTSREAFLLKVTRAKSSFLNWRYRLLSAAWDAGASPLLPLHVAGGSHLRTPVGLVEVYPYLEPSPNTVEPRTAGLALAQLHSAFGRQARPATTGELRLIPRRLAKLQPEIEELRLVVSGRLDLFPEDHDARTIASELRTLITRWNGRLSYCRDVVWKNLPAQLIHGDFHRENILCDQQRSCVITDFDKIAWGPRVYDVAKFVACTYVTQRGFHRREAEAFVEGYQSVIPLSRVEIASIPELMRALSIGATWVLEEYYLRGNDRVRPYIFEHATRLRKTGWTGWSPPPTLTAGMALGESLGFQMALPFS